MMVAIVTSDLERRLLMCHRGCRYEWPCGEMCGECSLDDAETPYDADCRIDELELECNRLRSENDELRGIVGRQHPWRRESRLDIRVVGIGGTTRPSIRVTGFGARPHASGWESIVYETLGRLCPEREWVCLGDDERREIAGMVDAIREERVCHPRGKWENVTETLEIRFLKCDCGEDLGIDQREKRLGVKLAKLPNYCPNCGARIEVY